MRILSFLTLALFVSLTPMVQCIVMLIVPPVIGPDTPEAVFKGQITENGKPVSAHLSLEVLYKANGEEVQISLVQTNTISNYDLRVSGILLSNENITYTAFLRAQALSINGGSKMVQLKLEDHKMLYEQDIELGRKHPKQI